MPAGSKEKSTPAVTHQRVEACHRGNPGVQAKRRDHRENRGEVPPIARGEADGRQDRAHTARRNRSP